MDLNNIIPFISGGFAGALLNNWIIYRKERKQPILTNIEISEFTNYRPFNYQDSFLDAQIVLTGTESKININTLYFIEIDLINSGVRNFSKFRFGITLRNGIKVIDIQNKSEDRYHKIDLDDTPNDQNPLETLDLSLEPFNKKDKYSFKLLLTSKETQITKKDIELISNHSENEHPTLLYEENYLKKKFKELLK